MNMPLAKNLENFSHATYQAAHFLTDNIDQYIEDVKKDATDFTEDINATIHACLTSTDIKKNARRLKESTSSMRCWLNKYWLINMPELAYQHALTLRDASQLLTNKNPYENSNSDAKTLNSIADELIRRSNISKELVNALLNCNAISKTYGTSPYRKSSIINVTEELLQNMAFAKIHAIISLKRLQTSANNLVINLNKIPTRPTFDTTTMHQETINIAKRMEDAVSVYQHGPAVNLKDTLTFAPKDINHVIPTGYEEMPQLCQIANELQKNNVVSIIEISHDATLAINDDDTDRIKTMAAISDETVADVLKDIKEYAADSQIIHETFDVIVSKLNDNDNTLLDNINIPPRDVIQEVINRRPPQGNVIFDKFDIKLDNNPTALRIILPRKNTSLPEIPTETAAIIEANLPQRSRKICFLDNQTLYKLIQIIKNNNPNTTRDIRRLIDEFPYESIPHEIRTQI